MARTERTPSLEKHTHTFITGPARGSKVTHSHVDGATAHQHTDTGPAAYTIDKDSWFMATGLRGGGRKKFTTRPSGPQLERVELEEWQKSYTLIIAV